MRPLLIVSDVHLGHRRCDTVASDLARLVSMHAGHEIIFNGDTFNLACDPWARDPAVSAAAMLAAHPSLRAALARHLANGDPLTLVAGNHDMALAHPRMRSALLGVLSERADADLRIEPWMVRRDGIHIEHGHLYDPANSPTHPLTMSSFRAEPVGIELTRRFVGRYEAWEMFADRWTGTALDNLKVMVEQFGARAPLATLHYIGLLAAISAETAMPARLTRDRRAGSAALPAYAARLGVSENMLGDLLDSRHRPMHFSFRDTFRRFGFDAILALIAMAAGGLLAALTHRWRWLFLSATGLGYLVVERKRLAVRNTNHMPAELRSGAAHVRAATGARIVIFGHTHIEEQADGYLNLGAFGDRPNVARTYVHVDEHGRIERRAMPSQTTLDTPLSR